MSIATQIGKAFLTGEDPNYNDILSNMGGLAMDFSMGMCGKVDMTPIDYDNLNFDDFKFDDFSSDDFSSNDFNTDFGGQFGDFTFEEE